MAAFYARYVPSSRPSETPETYDRPSSKRKRQGEPPNMEARQKRAKTETGDKADRITPQPLQSSSERSREGDLESSPVYRKKQNIGLKRPQSSTPNSGGNEVLTKHSSIKAAEEPNVTQALRQRDEAGKAGKAGMLESDPGPPDARTGDRAKRKRKQKGAIRDEAAGTALGKDSAVHTDERQPFNDPSDRRHTRVRQKFEVSKAKARICGSNRETDDERKQGNGHSEDTHDINTTVELHGLEPLPQPQNAEPSMDLPTYSALPGWMATPLRVPASSTTDFKDLRLDQHLIANLRSKGLGKAFAVQAAVMPLLTEGTSRHKGDLCVSAVTGSGKTLAYVLPLIQALKKLIGTKLRGLIVVPTRELVVQTREVCEACAAGTSLRIATALGSKALKDEQARLVEKYMVYDPEQYKKECERPIDWMTFGLEDILAQPEEDTPANYVQKFLWKVDILITTPGRLVEHLRSTPGFNLDDVQWVVIDEADRLLNESFQEWIEVVRPALQSDAATRSRDELLRELRLEVPERHVQKVILSATMTQDISKLNSLDLWNPKLVIVGELPEHQSANKNGAAAEDNEPVPDANGTFNLPPTLAEFAVSAGDGSEKPLYLLELLNSQIIKPLELRNGLHGGSDGPASSKTASNTPNGAALESEGTSGCGSSDANDSDNSSRVSSSNSSSSDSPAPTTHPAQTALIFTRSTEAAARLSRLLCLLSPSLASRIGTITKSTNSSSSRKTLSQFRQGRITILVATDRASRGLDLPGLAHVVSYDIPTSVTTYIHRVGRTARAGKEGKAWTLVEHREARWFWNEIGKSNEAGTSGEVRVGRGERKVKRVNLDVSGKEVRKGYEAALGVLREEVQGKS